MSHATYNAYWDYARERLELQLDYEAPKDRSLVPADTAAQVDYYAALYVRYVQIYRRLETAYDQIVHPQKRQSIRQMLGATIGRLLEVKQQLEELEASDVHVFNDLLNDLKLSAEALEVPTPRFYREERAQLVAQAAAEALAAAQAVDAAAQSAATNPSSSDAPNATPERGASASSTCNAQPSTASAASAVQRCDLSSFALKELAVGKPLQEEPPMSLAEAILVIQTTERGRQDQQRGALLLEVMRNASAHANAGTAALVVDDDGEKDVVHAARTIQRVYRGHRARRQFKQLQQADLVFLGMRASSTTAVRLQELDAKLAQIRTHRKEVQMQHQATYEASLTSTRAKLEQVEGPAMKEALQDSFRQWYMEQKRANGKFPEFPREELWKRKDFFFGMSDPALADVAQAAQAAETAGGKKKADQGAAAAAAAANGAESGPLGGPPSKYLALLQQTIEDYRTRWLGRDESDNVGQAHDQEQVRGEKRQEVYAQVKDELFGALEEELTNLAIAVDKEKINKKGRGAKKAGGKSGKKDKGKKGKEKDLTADRTMESLVQELVNAGILVKPAAVALADFKGGRNPSAQSKPGALVPASLADIRRLLCEDCILPHGYPHKEDEPELPGASTVLLCGPSGCGKTMLASAVANELGAYVFDLTPRVTAAAEAFSNKDSVPMLLHMVFKVARAHAPSVIYIDDAEMVFAKKVPKEDTTDPKRIKKDLAKALKRISVRDGIVVIGTTSKPWDADAKTMVPVFQKIVVVPALDYDSRWYFWRMLLAKYMGAPVVDASLNTGYLARVTQGMTVGDIDLVCQRVFSTRRLTQLRAGKQPLQLHELLDAVFQNGRVAVEPQRQTDEFFERLPLQRKRLSGPGETPSASK